MKIIKEYFKSEETHVFMNWKIQHHKDVNCPQTDLQVNAILIKIPLSFPWFVCFFCTINMCMTVACQAPQS